jgi:hypothetical protein
MPLPSCNPWASNTVRFSDQIAACRETSSRALETELHEVTFLLTVIDALERRAKGATGTFQPLTAYNQCDGEANAKNAFCSLNFLSPPFQADKSELKQIILWQLANGLCG